MPAIISQSVPFHYHSLPGPLHTLIQCYLDETQPFRKIHRLIDTLEWAVKWHTVLAVSDVTREAKLSPSLKVLFAIGLMSPSLGIWMRFYRESIENLRHSSLPFSDWDRLLPLDKKHNLITFRNSYAHGGTPEDAKCLDDCKTYFPVIEQIIVSPFFTKLNLAVSGEHGVHILLGDSERSLDMDLPLGQTAGTGSVE